MPLKCFWLTVLLRVSTVSSGLAAINLIFGPV